MKIHRKTIYKKKSGKKSFVVGETLAKIQTHTDDLLVSNIKNHPNTLILSNNNSRNICTIDISTV